MSELTREVGLKLWNKNKYASALKSIFITFNLFEFYSIWDLLSKYQKIHNSRDLWLPKGRIQIYKNTREKKLSFFFWEDVKSRQFRFSSLKHWPSIRLNIVGKFWSTFVRVASSPKCQIWSNFDTSLAKASRVFPERKNVYWAC